MTLPGKDIAFDLRNRKSSSVTAATASGVLPAGGATGAILTKNSTADYDVSWQANTAIQKGDGIFVRIRNNTGSTLTKGQIVYTNGATGNKVTVALARANADATSARTLGWIEADILVNDEGWVQIEGYLSGIDTAAIADGSQLYLSPTTAGAFTATKPSAPNHLVYVGVVAKSASAAGGGAVLIKAQNGYEVDEIHDIAISGLANNDILQYESVTDLWKNKTLFNAGIMGLAGGTFTGSVIFNQNTTGYGTLTQWSNQQTAIVARTGQNWAGNLVTFSLNDTTVVGGIGSRGNIFLGSTGGIGVNTYNLSATNPFVSSTQATFTVSTATPGSSQPFAVGQKIKVNSASQAQYNGDWIVTAVGGVNAAWTVTVTSGSGTTPFTNGGALTATGNITTEPMASFKANAPSVVPLSIMSGGTSGNSTDMFRLYDSAGNLRTYFASSGDLVVPAMIATWQTDSRAQDRNVIPIRARFTVSNAQTNIQTWESSAAVLAGMNARGQFFTGGTVPATGSTTISFAPTVAPTGTTDITITLAANHNIAVGQTVVVSGVTPAGYNGTWRAQNGTSGTLLVLNIGSNPGAVTVNGTMTVSPQMSITPDNLASAGLVIKALASQTTNLFEAQSSTGSVLSSITSAGNFNTGQIRSGTTSGLAQITGIAGSSSTIGALIRGASGQSVNLQEWQTNTPTTVAYVRNDGLISSSAGLLSPWAWINGYMANTTLAVTANNNAAPTAIIRGTGSQTVDLLQLQNSTPTTVFKVGITGDITGGYLYGNGLRDLAATGPYLNTSASQFLLDARSSGNIPLIIRGASGQSVNLLEFDDFNNNTLSYFKPDGSLYINSNANATGVYFKGTASDQSIRANGNDLFITPRFDLIFNPTDTTGRLRPVNDNQSDLGTSGQRWKTLFAASATLNGLTLSSTTSPITLNASVGTAGQVLASGGPGATPTWVDRMSNPMTTQGDIIYGGASGAPLRLAPSGTNGWVLTYDTATNAPKWAAAAGGTFTGGTLQSTLILDDGTTTSAPLKFDATGTSVLTTPEKGAVEYDGKVAYLTPDTTPGRAVDWTPHYITFSSGPDFSTSSAAVSIIDGVTKGITLLAGMTYEFELHVALRYQSFGDTTTALNIGWNTSTVSGTPTVSWVEYLEYASNTTGFTTAATMSTLRRTTGTFQIAASPGASGSRYVVYKQKGLLTITGTGSIKFYPTLSASASTVNVPTYQSGSIFMVTPLGNGTFTQVGAWA